MAKKSEHYGAKLQQHDDDLYEYEAPRPRRTKLWVLLGVILLLGGVAAAEWRVSALVSKKLRAMVSEKTNAQLTIGSTFYVPPYSAIILNPQLMRGSQAIFSASQMKLSLAALPSSNRPLVISSLRMISPRLNLGPDTFTQFGKPSTGGGKSQKFSDMLRLSDVHLSDGRVQWRDPAQKDAPPTIWDGLALDVDTVQKSPSNYSFRLVSRAMTTADVGATGDIDVDSLVVVLRSLSLKVHAEPEPVRSPLPAAVQACLKKFTVDGNLSVDASGTIPLRDANQAAFSAVISLEDGLGRIPALQWSIDHASAEMTAEKKPGEAVVVNVQKIDMGSIGKSLVVNKGKFVVNAANQRWALSDCGGRFTIDRPPADAAATTEPTSPIAQLQLAGRAEFSINASAPFHLTGKPWEAIDHEIVINPRGASFVPKDFAHRMEDVGGGEIRIKGGMVIFQEISALYGEDAIQLRSARLPLEGLPELAKWQEISASITFHQPIRRYAPLFDTYFDALNPNGTFLLAGSYTMDHRAADSKTDFELIVSSDTGGFELTPYHIPLKKVRGDATITPAGVQLHGVEAELLNGQMTLTGQWSRANDTTGNFDGDITMNNVDLGQLANVSDNPPDLHVKGKLFGQASFSGTTVVHRPHLDWTKALRCSGEGEIVKGDLFQLPVLKDVFDRIHPLRQAATVGDAAAVFDVVDEQVMLRDAAVNAPVLGLQGSGKVGFDGKVDMRVVAAPLADWRDRLRETKIPIVSDVAGEVAGAVQKLLNTATGTLLYEFHVTGDYHQKLETTTVPAPVLTETAANVYARMLSPQQGAHPLDWFTRDEPRGRGK